MIYPKTYDVIVVGGGHALRQKPRSPPPVWARRRFCSHTILKRSDKCRATASIGGIGKGHLVRELDALGGAMALATDKSGIQFRRLNASKGAAVRATRAGRPHFVQSRHPRNVGKPRKPRPFPTSRRRRNARRRTHQRRNHRDGRGIQSPRRGADRRHIFVRQNPYRFGKLRRRPYAATPPPNRWADVCAN